MHRRLSMLFAAVGLLTHPWAAAQESPASASASSSASSSTWRQFAYTVDQKVKVQQGEIALDMVREIVPK